MTSSSTAIYLPTNHTTAFEFVVSQRRQFHVSKGSTFYARFKYEHLN